MIEVTVADIVSTAFFEQDVDDGHYIVVLWDEAGRRVLPIWIGPFEAHALAVALGKGQMPRPLTYTFAANLLRAAGARIEEVQINALRGETFYAVAKLAAPDGHSQEVDARPSDAVNLATVVGCPIYVSREVMEKNGVSLPDGETLRPHHGLQRLLEENPIMRAVVQLQTPTPGAEPGARGESRERTQHALAAYLVGKQG